MAGELVREGEKSTSEHDFSTKRGRTPWGIQGSYYEKLIPELRHKKCRKIFNISLIFLTFFFYKNRERDNILFFEGMDI